MKWFHIINPCLLPLLPFPPPAGFPFSQLSSSLQPTASLLFWQLFLMLTKPPTDGILLHDCGFLSPASPAFLFFPPFCFLLIVIRGTLYFFFIEYDGERRGVEFFCLAECQNKKIRIMSNPCLLSHLSHCVCLCLLG